MGIWQIIKGEEPGYIQQWLNYENTGQFGEYLIDYALSNNLFEGMYVLLRNVYFLLWYMSKTAFVLHFKCYGCFEELSPILDFIL